MRWVYLSLIALTFFVTTPLAEARQPTPVDTVDGSRLILQGVGAERRKNRVHVSGWVRRASSAYGPISAHLHVEALSAEGNPLEIVETAWQGDLRSSIRHRRAAAFRADLQADEKLALIRVTIVPGKRHDIASQ